MLFYLENIIVVLLYKKGVGEFMLLGLFKVMLVKVLVIKCCFGKNFFIGVD